VSHDPKVPRKNVLMVTKPSAATSQLETAIQLWFLNGDPVSIHTLAVAANDCFNALSKLSGKTSLSTEWLKSQSKRIQQRTTEAQNFFKHGLRHPNKRLQYMPFHSELLMFDSALSYEYLFKRMRPLMELFMLRFAISHPEVLSVDVGALVEATGFAIDEIAPLSRPEFFKKILSRLVKERP
jgi:hypothetical protein